MTERHRARRSGDNEWQREEGTIETSLEGRELHSSRTETQRTDTQERQKRGQQMSAS